MRAAQAAQVMPSIRNSAACAGTEYPVRRIASTTAAGEVTPGSTVTCAASAAKLTLAATPGSRFRLFSILAAQAAQVMPSTGRSRRSVEEEPMGAAFGRIFDVTQTIYPGGVLVKYPHWV